MKININKLVSILLVCFMALFVFTACISKDETINIEDSKPTLQNIGPEDSLKVTKKSVVIAAADWEPYEFQENGQVKGIGVDIVTEAFNRMGYKVIKKFLPFSRAVEMLRNGEIDVITDVKKTEERQKFGIFPKESIITAYTSLFVKSDSEIKFDGNILALKPYKIGIIRDYTYGAEFDKAVEDKILKVEVVDDKKQNMNKILDNRIDIYIENKLVEEVALKATNNENKIQELKPELNKTELYAYFSKKKNPGQMIDEFDKKLAEIKKDGTFEKIYSSYIK